MWSLVYQFGAPKRFYQLAGIWSRWLMVCAVLLLAVGWIGGLFIVPADYQQGDMFRLIYIHVPAAFMSLALYAMMGFLAVLVLVWRIKIAGVMLKNCAECGAMITLLALVTGSIWGKPMWGTWWIWDARLTSELILFFLYVGVLALAYACEDPQKRDKITAVLTLVGIVDLPVIHYSVYWWNTLHQGATLSLFAKPKIHSSMLWPLLLCLVGLACYCMMIVLMRTRIDLLWRERRQDWVRQLIGSRF